MQFPNSRFKQYLSTEIKLRGYEFGNSLIYLTHVTNVSCIIFIVDAQFPIKSLLFQLTHILYYTITVINHFTRSQTIRKFTDFLFSSLVMPLGLLVFAMYYGLHSMGDDLVFPVPKGFKKNDPAWLDFVHHVNVAVLPLIDVVVSKHKFPGRLMRIVSLLGLLACYLAVILLVNYKTGKWVYGILGKCNLIQRISLIAGCGVAGIFSCVLCEFCNSFLVKHSDKPKNA